jgi:rhamnopyranosyl-N-acetylglucosaminyl-diphospho-decaprenol beta-1,3/1,4-galactofuranosyltransferase
LSDHARASVAVAILTHNRPDDVAVLLKSLSGQTAPVDTVVLVDNGTEHCDLAPFDGALDIRYIQSESNLGGAGGFSLAILTALSTTADWVWIMDDDACPEDAECLAVLLAEAEQRHLSAVSPIIVAPEDATRLSFPFRIDGRLTYDRATVEQTDFWPGHALLFNGLLIRREALFEVGLPDLKLFIRGDEVDYLLRLRRSGLPFGTITAAAFTHPTGWAEATPIVQDRFHILVPETEFKRYYFFRNRGYLVRRHKRPVSLLVDLVGYAVHYLVRERDPAGFRRWLSAFRAGLREDFSPPGSANDRTRGHGS